MHLKNASLLSKTFQCFVIYSLFKWFGVDFLICCILLSYCVFLADMRKTGIGTVNGAKKIKLANSVGREAATLSNPLANVFFQKGQ